MKINVVIPNYNGSVLIKKNLPSVVASLKKYPEAEIIIVDDGSDEEDFQELESFITSFKKEISTSLTLLRHTPNRGFSSTVNQGVFSKSSDYVVLLNSDVSPEPDFLGSSLDILQSDPNIFGVGSMDKSIEGEKTVLRGRGIGSFKKGFLIHRRGEVNKENTLWISGGSSVIRTELYKRLGGFDETFNPFYWEDIDLSYRALKSGYQLVFNAKSIVEHQHGEGAIKQNFTETNINKAAYRNQFMFVWKNITDISFIFQHLIYLPIHFIKGLLRGDLEMIKGFIMALQLFPKIMHNKSIVRQYFTYSDHQVLAEFQTNNEKQK